jgi:Flp pilus assembly protein TadG
MSKRSLRFRLAALCAVLRDRRGNVAIITAIMLPVLLGGFGISFETAGWYQGQRAMQNAADSAAVAAGSNASASYATEAKAVAAQYGFVDGVAGTTVTASNAAACPSGGTSCYSVTISKPQPLYLVQVLGFSGTTTYNGSAAELITATSVAVQATAPRTYCLLALAGSGAAGITSNGAPFANLQGCDVMSNTSATCHGHNLNAGHGDAHTTSSGCGAIQDSGVPAVTDPYSYLAVNIPTNPCSSYPQEPAKKHDPSLPAGNQLSGSLTWGATQVMCGDVQLTGDVALTTASPGTVLVIENGQLDTNGHTLQTLAGAGLTVVFSGTNGAGYTPAPTGGGTLDIAAPTSGTWSGVAIYQDPAVTNGVDVAAAGNSPTWDITGLVYLPHSSVTFSGAVNKSSNGASCFDLVVDNITINGTGSILNEGQCNQAGLTMPTNQIPTRGALVG